MLLKLLLKRGKYYYFRWQLPSEAKSILRKRELITSLKTSHLLSAIKFSIPLYNFVNLVKKITTLLRMNQLSSDNYNHILKLIWEYRTTPLDLWSDELKGIISPLGTSPESRKRIEAYKDLLPEGSLSSYLDALEEAETSEDPPLTAEDEYAETIEELDGLKEYLSEHSEWLKKASQTGWGGNDTGESIYEWLKPNLAMDLLNIGVNEL